MIPEPFWVVKGNKVKCPVCDLPLKTYVKYRNHYIRRHSLDRVKSQTLVLQHDPLPGPRRRLDSRGTLPVQSSPPVVELDHRSRGSGGPTLVAKQLIEAELDTRKFLNRFNRLTPKRSVIQAIGKGDRRVELTADDLQRLIKMAEAYDGIRGLIVHKDIKPSEKYKRIHTIIKAMER